MSTSKGKDSGSGSREPSGQKGDPQTAGRIKQGGEPGSATSGASVTPAPSKETGTGPGKFGSGGVGGTSMGTGSGSDATKKTTGEEKSPRKSRR